MLVLHVLDSYRGNQSCGALCLWKQWCIRSITPAFIHSFIRLSNHCHPWPSWPATVSINHVSTPFRRISRLFKLENELENNCCQSRLNWFAFAATRRLLSSTSPSSDESSPPTFFGVSGTSRFTFHFAFYLNLQAVCLASDDNKQRKKRWLNRGSTIASNTSFHCGPQKRTETSNRNDLIKVKNLKWPEANQLAAVNYRL